MIKVDIVLDSKITDRGTGFEYRVYRATTPGKPELKIEAQLNDPSMALATDFDAEEFVREKAMKQWGFI